MRTLPILLLMGALATAPLCIDGQQTSGQNAPTQTNGDIPQQKPGTNNPDVSPDANGTTGTDTSSKTGAKKKRRHKGSSSTDTSATHTAPTA